MCGICGFIGEVKDSKNVLKKMMDKIAHRGPDDEGMYVDEYAALGHRRLSIIDLSHGAQPMYNETGDISIVFNGEIYNHLDIRKELIEKGHIFANDSDTECLIHAYEEYGTEMVQKLRGMFAFVIWDSKNKTAFCARDHFGIKPFYYANVNNTLVFSSEIKAILEFPGFKKEVNTDLWVHELLKEAGIRENFDAQGSNVKEINEALKTASKKGTGNSGFPEYVGIVKDFLIIIEDKPGLSKHINYTDDDLIADDVKSNTDYAVNGAVFYAKHLADKVSYKKIIAVGISGNEKKHRITPVFVNERGEYFELADIETLISFSVDNIDEYYVK